MPSRHPSATSRAAFVRGELSPSRLGPFEAHVSSCSSCAAELAEAARVELVLRALARELRCGTAADPMYRCAAEEAAPRSPSPRTWAQIARAAFAAVAALCVLGAAVRAPEGAVRAGPPHVLAFAPEGRHGTEWLPFESPPASALGSTAGPDGGRRSGAW